MSYRKSKNRFLIICAVCCIVCVCVGGVSAALSMGGKNNKESITVNAEAKTNESKPKTEQQTVNGSLSGKKIIVDAGHGGADSGTIGVSTGVYEKDINLKLAYKLKEKLEKSGAEVVMTLTNKKEAELGTSKKLQISERGNLIEQSNANMLISIHPNANDDRSCTGTQILYYDTKSEKLAKNMQKLFNDELNKKRNSLKDSYHILKYGNQPSVIVECGFLSTPQEEKLLQTDDYQERLLNILIESIKSYLKQQ